MAKQKSTAQEVVKDITPQSETTPEDINPSEESQDQESTPEDTIPSEESQDQESTDEMDFLVVKGFANLEGSFNVGDKYNGSLKSAKSLLRNGLIKIVK